MIQLLSAILITISAQANSSVCLDGFYDLGERAAALGFLCELNEPKEKALIVFCKREILIEEGYCTGSKRPIPCEWKSGAWNCEEKGNYPFFAEIRKLSEDKISYKFKSSFNQGELEGTRIP